MVPRLSYHVFPLKAAKQNGFDFIGRASGVVMLLDGRLRAPVRVNTYPTDGYRSVPDEPRLFAGSAVIALGHTPSTPVDNNMFHCCYIHVSNRLLETTEKQTGVTLEGDFHTCIGCLMSKGFREQSISSKTSTRATKKLGRVFVDLNGLKSVPAPGGEYCTRRLSSLYLNSLPETEDGHCKCFQTFLANTATGGKVEIVRSDVGVELKEKLSKLCDERQIRLKLTIANSP